MTDQIQTIQKLAAAKLNRILMRLRDLHPDMTVSQVQILLFIASNPGVISADLHQLLGQTDSAVSRNLDLLTDRGTRYGPGLHLVVSKENPKDRREKLLYLSGDGEKLIMVLAGDLLH